MDEPSGLIMFLDEPDFSRVHAYDEALKADAVRLQLAPFVGAPHGYYVVTCDGSVTGQAIFHFAQGDDIFAALEDARRADSQPPLPEASHRPSRATSQTPRASQYASGSRPYVDIAATSSRMAAVIGAPVAPAGLSATSRMDPRPAAHFTQYIYPKENNSLILLERSGGYPIMYTTTMKLDTDNTEDMDLLASSGGVDFKLAIDTAEGLIWFYAHGFKCVLVGEGGDQITDWPTVGDVGAKFRYAIVSGPEEAVLEECRRVYGDGTVAHLQRWGMEYGIPMKITSWQWAMGEPGHSTLILARVLAKAVCNTTASRSYDGLFGARGIGARSLQFDRKKEPCITFYDALERNTSHAGHMQNLKQFLTRFRHPYTYGSEDNRGRGRSFIYFGDHWPCGLRAKNDKIILPKLTPKIYIWPTLSDEGLWDFQFWLLRIIGLALMRPKVSEPDHESDSPSDWDIIPISVPNRQSRVGSTDRGFTALVDSGTSQSYLPPDVFNEIRAKWFGLVDERRDIYCEDRKRFKECDVVFRFLGLDGAEIPFRVSAVDFLCSPYARPQGGVQASIASRAVPDNTESPHAILGQNFFWSAFIKHNFENYSPKGAYSVQPTGASGPYMQLAPQLIVAKAGGRKYVYGQEHILLHAGLPGRLEGIRLTKKPMDL